VTAASGPTGVRPAVGDSRTLVLLRHAKSAYPEGVPDHRRPLAARGEREAPVAGALIAQRVGRPDLVVVSGATRTRQTWDLAASAWPSPPHTVVDERVYEASVDDLVLLLRELSGTWHCVVLVGHNPGVEDLAFTLSDDVGDPDALRRMSTKFPTSGIAVFDVDRPWEHLVAGRARLRSFDVARAAT
jgi:phosphohistidine phosphatase